MGPLRSPLKPKRVPLPFTKGNQAIDWASSFRRYLLTVFLPNGSLPPASPDPGVSCGGFYFHVLYITVQGPPQGALSWGLFPPGPACALLGL